MSEQGGEPPAGAPAIRASDADRERVADVVRRAVGDGRLTVVEGDERQTRAYGAVHRHELAPIVADLEAGPTSAVAPVTVVGMHGIGLMGGFADRAGPPSGPGGPRLDVSGFAMFGGVSVVRRALDEESGSHRR